VDIRQGMWAGVLGALAATAVGCGSADENSCATWVERLKTAGAMDRSLDRIAELKCVEALPAMRDLFAQGQLQDRILQTAKQIGKGDDPATVEILRAALKTNKLANMAAGMAQDWKVAAVLPELTAIMTDPNLVSLREAAFPALLALSPDPKALEDLLIGVAAMDANAQSVSSFKLAARELGNIGSTKALPHLLKLAYFKNNKGEEVFQAARRALAQVGDATLSAAVVEVAAGKHKEIDAFTRALNVPDWQGTLGAKTVQLLIDRLEPSVVPALLEHLSRPLVPPQTLSETAKPAWQAEQRNRLQVALFGLGHTAGDAAIPELLKVANDAQADFHNQRSKALLALALLGSEAAQDAMFAAIQAEPEPMIQAFLLQHVARGVDDRRLKQLDALLGSGNAKGIKALAQSTELADALKDEAFVGFLAVVRTCKDDKACVIGKLKSENPHEQVKAIHLLASGRFGDGDDVREALFSAFKAATPKDVDRRRFSLMGLTRLGKKADGERLVSLSEGLPEEDVYWKEELFAFGKAMSRR
jgi:hypothetical protein